MTSFALLGHNNRALRQTMKTHMLKTRPQVAPLRQGVLVPKKLKYIQVTGGDIVAVEKERHSRVHLMAMRKR